jgi:flavodoxin I
MSKIAIVYSFHTQNTKKAAEMVVKKMGKNHVEKLNVEDTSAEEFMQFDTYILGSATWFEGELPNHWDEFLPSIEERDFSGKKVALFGLADQVNYPDFFGDAIGRLAEFFQVRGAKIIGHYPNKDYSFTESFALRGDKFVGVILDYENQADMAEKRIEEWVKILDKEL